MADPSPSPEPSRAADDPHRALRMGFMLVYGLTLLLVLPALLPPGPVDDGWFHLATGDWILREGRLPQADPFAHTTAGRPLMVHSWLANVLFAGAREQGGLIGLRLLVGAVFAGGLAAWGALFRRHGWAGPLCAAAPLLLLVLHADRLRLRPEAFTFLCVPLLALALEAWRSRGRALCLPTLLVGLLVAVWSNLHIGCLLAPLVAGAVWVAGRFLGGGPPALPALAVPLVFAATLANPYGPGLYRYTVEAREVAGLVREWQSVLGYAAYPSRWPLLVAPLFAGALCAAGLRRAAPGTPVRAWSVAALGLFLHACLQARFLFLLGLPVATLTPPSWRRPRRALVAAALVTLAAAAGLLLVRGDAIALVLRHPTRSLRAELPAGAAAFLARLPRRVDIWSPSHWGAFLADQAAGKARIYSDGRMVLYGRAVMDEALALEQPVHPGLPTQEDEERQAEKERLLAARRVEALVAPPGTWPRGGAWFRAFASPSAEVFLHRERAADLVPAVLDLYRGRGLVLPADVDPDRDLDRVEAAIGQHLGLR